MSDVNIFLWHIDICAIAAFKLKWIELNINMC